MGEMLKEMPKNKGLLKQGNHLPRLHDVTSAQPTLAEIGIAKHESSRYQKIAELPEEKLFIQHKTTHTIYEQ